MIFLMPIQPVLGCIDTLYICYLIWQVVHAVAILIPNNFCLIGLDDLYRYILTECPLIACLQTNSVQNMRNDAASLL